MVQLEVMQSDESRREEWRVGMVGGSRGGGSKKGDGAN